MSYDILLVDRADGEDWDAAVERWESLVEEDAPAPPERLAAMRERLDRIALRLADLDTWTRYDADGVSGISGESVPISVDLEVYGGTVSYPYWEQDDPTAFRRTVADVVRIAAEETGLEAWDPQTGEAFDGTFHDERGLEAMRRIAARDGSRWDLLAWLYLVQAVVCVLAAVVLIATDTGGVLAWLLGAVGIAGGLTAYDRVRG